MNPSKAKRFIKSSTPVYRKDYQLSESLKYYEYDMIIIPD